MTDEESHCLITTRQTSSFRTFIKIYSLFKSERLSANIKLTLHETLIKSVMTYACPAWEFGADTHLLKLKHLQNKFLRTNGKFSRCTLVHELRVAFQVPHIYDHINKLCRQQAEVIQNHENANVQDIRKSKAQHRKYKRWQSSIRPF
jgi:hypothetical protein